MRPLGQGWLTSAGVGAGLLAGSWYALKDEACQRADVQLGALLRRRGFPGLERAVTTTTDLGSLYAVAGTAAALAVAGRRRAALDVLAVGVATWSVAQAAKTGVGRVRPYEADGVRRLIQIPTGSSFPSGHAAVGMAVATVLADRSPRPVGRVGLRLVGSYVAASRVYVGVHYPTDVLGGAGIGLLLGAAWRGPVAAAARGLARATPAGRGRGRRS